MYLMNYLGVLSKNRSVIICKGEEFGISYGIHQGFPGAALLKNRYYEVTYIKKQGSRVEFGINLLKKKDKFEKIDVPLLAETLDLVQDVHFVKILKDGQMIENLKPEYLELEVKELYCKDDMLYIEI